MKTLKKIINLVTLLILSMITLQISPALAGDKLQSMDELPTIGSCDGETIKTHSLKNQLKNTVNNDIVILY